LRSPAARSSRAAASGSAIQWSGMMRTATVCSWRYFLMSHDSGPLFFRQRQTWIPCCCPRLLCSTGQICPPHRPPNRHAKRGVVIRRQAQRTIVRGYVVVLTTHGALKPALAPLRLIFDNRNNGVHRIGSYFSFHLIVVTWVDRNASPHSALFRVLSIWTDMNESLRIGRLAHDV